MGLEEFSMADIAQWGMAGVLVLIVFTWLFKVHLPALDRSRDKERDAWSAAVERGVTAAEAQATSQREAVKEMAVAHREAISDLTAHQRDTVKSIVDAGNANKEADRELLRDMIKAVGEMRDVVAKCPMIQQERTVRGPG